MDIKVYKAISNVRKDLAKAGISKDRTNSSTGGTFKYRGIDDVYEALASILSTHGLCPLPRVMEKEVVERVSKSGGALFYSTVLMEFDLISDEDGSKHTVSSYGEAMDSGDKSLGKAMSYAYKAMAFMTFSIPIQGEDNDPDAQSHEVASKTPVSAPVPPQSSVAPKAVQSTKHCAVCNTEFIPPASYPKAINCSGACGVKYKTGERYTPPEALPVIRQEAPEGEVLFEDLPF